MKRNTSCNCEKAGWCSRHSIEKNEHEFRLCQFNPASFQQWEQGERPNGYALHQNNGESLQRDPLLKTAVAIISHNYGHFLEECIESVLNQTVTPNEIIVVDDASTDNTKQIVEKYAQQGVQYEFVEYQNVHQTRRRGFELTEAPIVCFLDADDVLSPDYLEQGLSQFADYRIGVVYSDCQLFGARSDYIAYPEKFDAAKLELDNYIHAGSLVRRDAIEISRVFEKQFDPLLTQGDWFLWRHILRDGWQAAKQQAVYHYRQHHSNWMQSMQKEKEDYFKYAGLEFEQITLCMALSGRMETLSPITRFLERQTWPHDQIKLVLLDTSQDQSFGQSVRTWLSESDYSQVSYQALSVGPPRLADENRREEEIQTSVRQAMARIYNYFARLVTTEYVWFLEDDVIPAGDVCRQLLGGFNNNVASVAAPYRSRFQDTYCVWNIEFHQISEPGFGLQKVEGNGFGCTIIRGSLLKQTVFTSQDTPADFDIAFYSRLKESELEARVNWDCKCEHLGATNSSNAGKWKSLYGAATKQKQYGDELTYHRAAQFLADCEQIEDWGAGLGWFSRIFPEYGSGQVTNIDGTKSRYSHKNIDLCEYQSDTEGILLRHVLEHDYRWREILLNALKSCQDKLVIVTYTPFGEKTHNIKSHRFEDEQEVPVLSFCLEDLLEVFQAHPQFAMDEESLTTKTEYRNERLFYLQRKS